MKFLFFGQILSPFQGTLEVAISTALRLRGHSALHVNCGPRAFGICDVYNSSQPPGMRDLMCREKCTQRYEEGLIRHQNSPHRMNDFWLPEHADRALLWAAEMSGEKDLTKIEYKGYPLFEIAKWSAIRYLKRLETFDPNGAHRWITIEMMKNSRLAIDALERVLQEVQFDNFVLWNGLNFSHRAAVEVAKRNGINYFCFELGLNKNTCLLRKNQTAVPLDFAKEWEWWKDQTLNAEEETWISEYLRSREKQQDMTLPCSFGQSLDREKLYETLKVSRDKKLVPLFTNLSWDTSLEKAHFPFKNQAEWIEQTVRHLAKHPNYVAVVRIHPAELMKGEPDTKEPIRERIQNIEGMENVRIIGPESDLDSYSLMKQAAFGIPYVSTVGLEMGCQGKPIISGGYNHYRNKGFAWDPESKDHYFKLIDSMVENAQMPPNGQETAKRYTYFYFNRAIPKLDFMTEPVHGAGVPSWEKIEDLAPGKFPALDRIVDTLLGIQEFVSMPQPPAPFPSNSSHKAEEPLPFNFA